MLPSDLHESLGRHDEHTTHGSESDQRDGAQPEAEPSAGSGGAYIVIEVVAMTMMSLRM